MLSFICDGCCQTPVSAYPGPCYAKRKRKRAAFNQPYTWHFSTQGLPEVAVTSNNRGLLPHVFTLISKNETVIFCGTFSSCQSMSPAVSRMRCSMLSGLSFPLKNETIAQLAANNKGTFRTRINQNIKSGNRKSSC